jgi:hypothetical protein
MLLGAPARHLHLAGAVLLLLLHADLQLHLPQRLEHGLLHVHLVVLQHLVLVVLVQLQQRRAHGLLLVHLVVLQHHDDVHLALHLLQAGLVNGDRSYPQLL